MSNSPTRSTIHLRLAAAAAVGVLGLSMAAPGTAMAQLLPGSTAYAQIGQSITLGRGNSVLCGGFFSGGITETVPPSPSGIAAFRLDFSPYFDGTCTIDTIVNWRNLATGASGTANRSITTTKRTPPFPASLFTGATIATTDPSIDPATGPGRVSFTVSTTSLHVPMRSGIYQVR